MRVLHIAETVHGGIATYLNQLIPHQLADFGDGNVKLIMPDEQLDCIDSVENCIGFVSKGRSFKTLFILLFTFVKIASNWKPDVIHIHSSFAGVSIRAYFLLTFWKKRPTVVYCAHGWAFSMSISSIKKSIYALIERLLSLVTEHIVCISEYEYDLALRFGINGNKCCVIYNGLAESPPLIEAIAINIDSEKLNCLFVGRYHEAKGFDTLIDYFGNTNESVCLYSAGGARLNNEISFDVSNNIVELGWLNPKQVQYLYESVDVVIVPSRWEGFGFVAIEAMRSGKVVIGSDRGGIPETIVHGETGLLYHFEDGVEAVLSQLLQCEKRKLEVMGRRGREIFLDKFTIIKTHEKLKRVYSKDFGC
jgi:glycosyltransferase involved in cell wall biosynthesis